MLGQQRLELLTGVLAALIGVMQQLGTVPPSPDRHEHCIADQASGHLVLH
jgi:hypothetical protein